MKTKTLFLNLSYLWAVSRSPLSARICPRRSGFTRISSTNTPGCSSLKTATADFRSGSSASLSGPASELAERAFFSCMLWVILAVHLSVLTLALAWLGAHGASLLAAALASCCWCRALRDGRVSNRAFTDLAR